MKTVATRFSLGTLLLLSSIACAQAVDPAPDAVLTATRDPLVADISREPRYTCAQNLTREFYAPSSNKEKACVEVIASRERRKHEPPLAFWDRLHLDVAIAGDREIHSWSGAPRFNDQEVGRLASNGPIGTEDFAGFVGSIFIGKAKVRYTGKHSAEGRALYDYSYEVAAQDSHYQVVVDPKPVVIAYSGSLTLDPKTSDIVELVVHTPELPARTDACQAQSRIEFRRQEIHGRDVLLPRETRLLWIDRFGGEMLSTTSYQKCQEYSGHAVLRFEGAGSAPNAGSLVPSVSAAVASIPAGLTFDCRILTAIDSDTSAAGDPVEGILRSPIRAQDGSILAPRGARVHGRLLFFAKYSLGNDFFQLGIHLESVEVNGAPVTLHAVVVEQPLLPGGATDRSPDPTHGVSPKALKNLPADFGLFSFSEEHLRLPHLDSRWISVSPASNSGQTCASSGTSGTTPSAGDLACPTSPRLSFRPTPGFGRLISLMTRRLHPRISVERSVEI